MSKKNLAKTAIEGGRYGRNKWDRRNSHNEERNAAREYCKQVIRDPESADDQDLIEKKSKVYKEFRDKLSPMYRWLRAQVGRSWDDVRSEVFKKFDARTTAGRHILFDHLLKSVETDSTPFPYYFRWENLPDNPQTSYRQNDFYVDSEGILRERQYVSRKSRRPTNINTRWIAKWLNGRVIIRTGNKLYWCAAIPINGYTTEWKCEWVDIWAPLKYLSFGYESVFNPLNGKSTYKPVWREPLAFSLGYPKRITARQDVEFSKEDYEVWKEIPPYYQNKILEYSPTNK